MVQKRQTTVTDKVRVNFNLRPDQARRLNELDHTAQIGSKSEFVRAAIDSHLKMFEKKNLTR